MTNQLIKNTLFYSLFGGFGLYTFYEIGKSEFNHKQKSENNYNKMLFNYKLLESCNNHIIDPLYRYELYFKDMSNEEITKMIHPSKLNYRPECINRYNLFSNSYNEYIKNKYSISSKYEV